MAWENSFFFLLVITGVTGSAAYMAFKCLGAIAQKVGCVEIVYYMMKGVSVFSLLPVGYVYYKWIASYQLTGEIWPGFSGNTGADMIFQKIFCVWVTGAGIVGIMYCLRYLRFCRRKTCNIPFRDPGIERLFRSMYSKRCIKRVRIYRNFALESPCVMGVFRPILVLPECEYEKEEWEIILAHEATHVVCRDNLWKALGVVIAVLDWWNPLSHAVLKEMDTWAEIHCDYLVCKKFLNGNRKLYAMILVKVALGVDLRVSEDTSKGWSKEFVERIRRLGKCSVTTKHMIWGIFLAVAFAVTSSTVAVSAGTCAQALEKHICQGNRRQSAFRADKDQQYKKKNNKEMEGFVKKP